MNETTVIDKDSILKWMMKMVSTEHYKLFKPFITSFLCQKHMDPNTTPDKIPAQQWIGLCNKKLGSINLYFVDDEENGHKTYREFYNVLCREFEKINDACWNSGARVIITLESPSKNFYIDIVCEFITPKTEEGKFLFHFNIRPNANFIVRTNKEYQFCFYFNRLIQHGATFSFTIDDVKKYTLQDIYNEFAQFIWFVQNF